jgi:hypothetical protein
METNAASLNRRAFIYQLLAGSGLGIVGLPGFMRTALGMGTLSVTQGMRKVRGDVKINGVSVEVGTLVKTGDVVTTGPDSYAVFVIDKSAYLVRDNTNVELSSKYSDQYKEKIVNILRIINGKMLSVFGRRKRSIFTQTAVIGIRGTGIYVEAEAERTYVCTCYGVADINAKADPEAKVTVKTTHHESPRFVYTSGQDQLIVKAPVINHTDAELIMLESLVWRNPPFVEEEGDDNGGGY